MISSNIRYNNDFSEVFVLRNDTNGRLVSYEKLDKEMIFLHNKNLNLSLEMSAILV